MKNKVMELVTLLELCSRFNMIVIDVVNNVDKEYNHLLNPDQKLLTKEIMMISDLYELDIEVISSEIPPPPVDKQEEHKMPRLKLGLAHVITFGFDGLHFTVKTMADGMLKVADLIPLAEAKLVSKLIDKPVDHIVEDRHNTTAASQDAIVDTCKTIGEFVSSNINKAHGHVMEVIHETVANEPGV